MKGDKQIVLPVFYGIHPSDVRHQKRAYAEAFDHHESRLPGNFLKVQKWRLALKDAAALSGYDSSRYGNDSVLLNEIVKYVSLRLDHIYLSESRGLVGIDPYIEQIRAILEMESQEVQIIGICGIMGVGKTTLAQLAYDKFASRYEGPYFLDNVREELRKHGLKSLREKLISELQEGKSTIVLKNLFSRRKVLVVLYDVHASEQLQHLVTEGIGWGPGSRVIVTSIDMQVLIDGGVRAICELKKLDYEISIELFSLNAFKNSHREEEYEELSKRTVAFAQGLPLALKVLGLDFYSRDKETWESKLKKLEIYPHPPMQDVLKMSFDELEDVERDQFHGIAFFYNGEDKDKVIRLLDANKPFFFL